MPEKRWQLTANMWACSGSDQGLTGASITARGLLFYTSLKKTKKQGPRAQVGEQTEEPASHSSTQGCVPLACTLGWENTQALALPKSQLWGLGRWSGEPPVTP